ncbi:MAG: alpha/beta hydrolase [Armatimonadetes bacterium]|nr:alpha/beta hydrolase [Armatimonadota bacterium]
MPNPVPPVEHIGPLRLRRWGAGGPMVIVLHGGPAASGSAAPIARGLADGFRAIEPWQRGSSDEPLTVARHVADLHDLAASLGGRPAVVGESWGAMLALAYAAAHPEEAGPVVLVGCGTFDTAARERFSALVDERIGHEGRAQLARIDAEMHDPGERLQRRYEVIGKVYDFDPLPEEDLGPSEPFDGRAHGKTWDDMLRCQAGRC